MTLYTAAAGHRPPSERRVESFAVGGRFRSPAGRWETITDIAGPFPRTGRVRLYTDWTGRAFCWTFWRSHRLPYVPALRPCRVRRRRASARVVRLAPTAGTLR